MFPRLSKKPTHGRASSLPKKTLESIMLDMPMMIDSNFRQKPMLLKTQERINDLENKKYSIFLRDRIPASPKSRFQHYIEKLGGVKQKFRQKFSSFPKEHQKHSYTEDLRSSFHSNLFRTKRTGMPEKNLEDSKFSLRVKHSKTSFQLQYADKQKKLNQIGKLDDQRNHNQESISQDSLTRKIAFINIHFKNNQSSKFNS